MRTVKGVYKCSHFQSALRREGIQFQVYKNHDVKCCVVERVHRTIRYGMYKYFTYKKTYIYIDVLRKFLRAYNDTINPATGMALSLVIDLIFSRYERG